ncbi:MAG: TraR/DksA C4-type zinc finger protein [Candidatus Spechtbacterales bacterium]
MEKKELEKFKEQLLKQKDSLEQELKEIANQNPNSSEDWESKFPNFEQEDFDIEEAADEVEEYINRLPLEQALELKLKATKDALEKIEQDKYGICENCGKKIPQERLAVIPETKICLNCKEKECK